PVAASLSEMQFAYGERIRVVVDERAHSVAALELLFQRHLAPRRNVRDGVDDARVDVDHARDAEADPRHAAVDDRVDGAEHFIEHDARAGRAGDRPRDARLDVAVADPAGADVRPAEIDADDCFSHARGPFVVIAASPPART